MGKRKRASSSSLFLMELILSILIFCIAGTICISVFTKAHLIHKEAAALNNSIKLSRDVAEIVRSCSSEDDIKSIFNNIYRIPVDSINLNEDIIIYLNADFDTVSDTNSPYKMQVSPNIEDNMLYCSIDIIQTEKNESVYNLYIEHVL